MVEGEDLSSSLKHSSYYDTKSCSSFLKDRVNSFTVLSFNTASIRSKFDQIDIFLIMSYLYPVIQMQYVFKKPG